MNYIVLDMEWNQPYCLKKRINTPVVLHGEIVQIGAVKLDESCSILDSFKIMVCPKYYTKMNKKVMKLTGITNEQLKSGVSFVSALEKFRKWCGEDFVFFTWGPDDIRMLQSNMVLHRISADWLPDTYDVQLIYDSQIAKANRQVSLLEAMENMGIPALEAHDAFNDAQNTVCICQRLDIAKGIGEYQSLFHYISNSDNQMGETRKSSKLYIKRTEALKDPEIIEFSCPVCGEKVVCNDFVRQNCDKFMCISCCENEHEFFVRFKFSKNSAKKFRVSRVIYELTDEHKEYYETKKKYLEEVKKAVKQNQG